MKFFEKVKKTFYRNAGIDRTGTCVYLPETADKTFVRAVRPVIPGQIVVCVLFLRFFLVFILSAGYIKWKFSQKTAGKYLWLISNSEILLWKFAKKQMF